MNGANHLTIDLHAIQHNLRQVRAFAPRSKILAMVKSNAYGHGLARVAQALSDADALGIARLEEAIYLQQFNLPQPLVIMGGCFRPDDLMLAAAYEFEVVVHQHVQLQNIEQLSFAKPITVWLKIDSGMHRLGFAPEDVRDVWQRLTASSNVKKIRLMTHLASADEPQSDFTQRQLQRFAETTADLPGERSIANSAAILGLPEAHHDWVRPGIMLYGASPFKDRIASDHGLQMVSHFASHLVEVKTVKRGECIGYRHRIECPEDMPIGVVACGYGDGYPRSAADGAPLLVNDTLVALWGQVSMDLITVDLRPCPEARAGDPVVLWGNRVPIEYVARYSASLTAYDLMVSVSIEESHVRNPSTYLSSSE